MAPCSKSEVGILGCALRFRVMLPGGDSSPFLQDRQHALPPASAQPFQTLAVYFSLAYVIRSAWLTAFQGSVFRKTIFCHFISSGWTAAAPLGARSRLKQPPCPPHPPLQPLAPSPASALLWQRKYLQLLPQHIFLPHPGRPNNK